ncbi:MAG TPA: ABC transporter permease subunit [Cyclobacteriaceae bacterium]|nr:ABC transporter permease subunit [Cyclobacteriaceae bacterium]
MSKRGKMIEEKFFKYLMAVFTYSLIGLLFLILYEIFKKGFPALSWDMISQVPKGGFYFGKEGGILNAIVGSLYLALGASLLSILISLPVAIFISISLVKYEKWQHIIRLILDLLWGVPPIVYGAFMFSIMLSFGMKASLLAGIITIALLITPVMIRAMDEVLRNIPLGLLESSLSLGATRFETAVIFFRQALPGIATAFLLGFAKGVGDTAAVLFTVGYTDYIPRSVMEPAATLPLSIFFQLSSPIEEVKARAYAAAVVLTGIILIISVFSRYLSSRVSKNTIS